MRDDARTTLYGPRRLPFGHVPRRRLYDAFRYRGARVTLLCAPAGFGKSTLVREWLDLTQAPYVYYMPPTGNPTPEQLWNALANGLRRIDRDRGSVARDLLRRAEPDIRQVIEEIAVDLAMLDRDVVLVIEDLHKYLDPAVHRDIGLLAEQIPENAHLVLTSRTQPDVPMALLRSREQVAEIDAEQLQLTVGEVAQYLRRVGIEPTGELADHLEFATGGWAAGLSLVVAASQRRGDAPDQLARGALLTSTVGELLRSEVLAGMPAEAQELLTLTSFLPAITPHLCDHVTGRTDSAAILRRLSLDQTFVHRIEAPGEWYALHQLLSDLLRADQAQRDPAELIQLRLRASEWFGQAGRPADALEHAMLAGDADRMRSLVAEHAYYLSDNGYQWLARRALLGAESSLPPDPMESLEVAETLAFAGFGGPTLRVLAAVEGSGDGDRETAGRLAILRCLVASWAGDVEQATVAFASATELLGGLPTDELGLRTRLNFGRCLRLADELDRAEHELVTLIAIDGSDSLTASLFARGALAAVQFDRGDLARSLETVVDAAATWDERERPKAVGASDFYRVLGLLHEESGDVDEARELFGVALSLTTHTRPGLMRELVLADLGVFEARCGNIDLAGTYIGEIPTWWPDFPPGAHLVRSYHRAQVEVLLAAGRPDDAEPHLLALHRDEGDGVPLRDRVLRTRVDLALGEVTLDAVVGSEAVRDERLPVRLQSLLVDADVLLSLGDREAALRVGREAVALGLGAGFRATLGRSAAVRSLGSTLVSRAQQPLLDAVLASGETSGTGAPTSTRDLLSFKESEVLALLPTHLSYSGLASELFISVNTVKFHVKNIYAKLGVSDRAGAVARGRELGLIDER